MPAQLKQSVLDGYVKTVFKIVKLILVEYAFCVSEYSTILIVVINVMLLWHIIGGLVVIVLRPIPTEVRVKSSLKLTMIVEERNSFLLAVVEAPGVVPNVSYSMVTLKRANPVR